MSILSDLLSCLALSTFVSFIVPIVPIGTILAASYAVGFIPGCAVVGHIGIDRILEFLAIFGNGLPLQGIITIGLAWAFVGALLELFSFYVYQNWHSN